MSKRGKILKATKLLIRQQGKINIKLGEQFNKLNLLSPEDQAWFLRKLLKSQEFNDLPGEMPQSIAQEFRNLELKSEGILPGKHYEDDDDLPF